MREERENLPGPLTVAESIDLHGNIGGDITIVAGGKVYVRGSVYGNLTAEYGGRVHVLGKVKENVHVMPGSKVILSGAIGGDVINQGGRLFIHHTASIAGKLMDLDGKTEFAPGAKRPES